MKHLKLCWLALAMFATLNSRAALYSSGTLNETIGGVGETSVLGVSGWGVDYQISSVVLTLNVAGGYNGNLYAYLSFGGHLVTLFNQPGGLGVNLDPGFAVTISDTGASGIQTYTSGSHSYNGSSQLTGNWQPNNGGVTFAGSYNGLTPNGDWTLFIQDTAGGTSSMLTDWSLDLEAVPEPVNVALVVFGALAGIVALARSQWAKRLLGEKLKC